MRALARWNVVPGTIVPVDPTVENPGIATLQSDTNPLQPEGNECCLGPTKDFIRSHPPGNVPTVLYSLSCIEDVGLEVSVHGSEGLQDPRLEFVTLLPRLGKVLVVALLGSAPPSYKPLDRNSLSSTLM